MHKHYFITWLKYRPFLPDIFVLFVLNDPDREEAKRIDNNRSVGKMFVYSDIVGINSH